MRNILRSRRFAALASALALGGAALVATDTSVASPTRGCAVDRPCIDNAYYTKARNVYITWTATEDFDHYNVIWWRAGKARVQVEVGGGDTGWFRVRNARSWTTYQFLVQGCNKSWLGSSECSPWEPASVKVKSFS